MQTAINYLLEQVDGLKGKISDGDYLNLCTGIHNIYKIHAGQYEVEQEVEVEECQCDNINFKCIPRPHCINYEIIRHYLPIVSALHNNDQKVSLSQQITLSENPQLIMKLINYSFWLINHIFRISENELLVAICLTQLIMNNFTEDFNNVIWFQAMIDKIDYIIENYNSKTERCNRYFGLYLLHTSDQYLPIFNKWRDLFDEKLAIAQLMSIGEDP